LKLTMDNRLKAVYLFLSLQVIAITVAAALSCAKAPPTLSPAGAAAFQATRVVKALDVLRDFAVEAEAQQPPLISTETTRAVVLYHRSALRTIGAVPGGWKDVVKVGLEELRVKFSAEEKVRFQPYVTLVLTLIEEVTR
jgi:hypothetical protein